MLDSKILALYPDTLTPEEANLKDLMLRKGGITRIQWEQIERLWRTKQRDMRQGVSGTVLRIDYETPALVALNAASGQMEWRVLLPSLKEGQIAYNQLRDDNLLQPIGNQNATLFDAKELKKIGDWTGADGKHMGLLVDGKSFRLFSPTAFEQNHFIQTRRFVFPMSGVGRLNRFPCDMLAAPDGKRLFIADRGSGEVYIIDLEAQKMLASVPVRSPGSAKSLNLTISPKQNLLYVTDNGTSVLTLINLENFSVQKKSLSFGVLGNAWVAPDGLSLYQLILKPTYQIQVLSADTFASRATIALKGDPFSSSDDPCDLIAVAPDNKNLLVMSYVNDPTPFTPVVSIIEVESQKVIKRTILSAKNKPAFVGFSTPNPNPIPTLPLRSYLISENHVTESKLKEYERPDLERPYGTEGKKPETRATSVYDMGLKPTSSLDNAPPPMADTDKPALAAKISIPPSADDLIVEYLVRRFDAKTEIDLSVYPDCMGRLKTSATKARFELELYDYSKVKISYIFEEHHLEELIERATVLDMVHRYELDEMLKEAKMKSVPTNCPNCAAPLLGSPLCRACGFEIEDPEFKDAAPKKEALRLSSFHALENLLPGRFLVIDHIKRRVLEIDQERHIVWYLHREVENDLTRFIENPYDAIRLPNQNVLVTDPVEHRVAEITPKGRIYWEVNTSLPDLAISNPVKATRLQKGQTVIVDRDNHRIFEVSREQKLIWQYGKKGEAGIEKGQLNQPSDYNRLENGNHLIADTGNHRIIELDFDETIWQYGNEENVFGAGEGKQANQLTKPVGAFRLKSGNTLIIDSGNSRVIEVTPTKEIAWSFDTSVHGHLAPIKALRLLPYEETTVIFTERAVLEVEKDGTVIWSCQIDEIPTSNLIEIRDRRDKEDYFKNPTRRMGPRVSHLYKGDDGKEIPVEDEEPEDEVLTREERMSRLAKRAASREYLNVEMQGDTLPATFTLVDRTRAKVFQVDRTKKIIWRFGDQGELSRPHAATALDNGNILIADTENNRVIEVDAATQGVIWTYGEDISKLKSPRCALRLGNGNTLIADQGNNRVIEVTPEGELAWQYGGWNKLAAPYWVQRLDSGNTLIVDWGNHVILEVSFDGEMIWTFGTPKKFGSGASQLTYPEFATRLPTGTTLIADSRNGRVIEIGADGLQIIWQYDEGLTSPTAAYRLEDGHTAIIHGGNRQVLEINTENKTVWKYILPFERATTTPTA